jgi:nucleoside-diphosphate-sugar epimerase
MNTAEQHLIFGTGPVGKSIMTELLKRGKSVTMVNRSGTLKDAPQGINLVKGDASDPNFTRQVSKGKTHIYNCTNPAYSEWVEKFPPLNTAILEGAKAAKAKLIVMDNVYMYGDTKGKPLTQDLPYNAHNRKGTTRANMAREVLNAHQKGDAQVVLGRASDFFGAGVMDSAAGEIMFGNAVAGKTVQVLGNLDVPHTYTYMKDIGKGLVTLAEDETAYGKAWHLPNPQTVTTREFIKLIEKEVGKPLTIMTANIWMVRLLGLFMPDMREFPEMMYEFTQPFIVDDTPFKQKYGDLATPLPQAIAETVAWFKSHAQA